MLQMKFVAQALFYFLALDSSQPVSSYCTHGRLFIADADSGKVHAYEIDGSDKLVLINTINIRWPTVPVHLLHRRNCHGCRSRQDR
jgi:hypothetical protein